MGGFELVVDGDLSPQLFRNSPLFCIGKLNFNPTEHMDDAIAYSLQNLGNFLLSNQAIPYGNNIMKRYSFKKPLIEGTILARPNRFIMLVVLNGKKIFAHCPSTGRIGNIVFENVPCLLSKADNPKRKTKHTVEAIWLDELTSKKKWIGINQSATNRYIGFFLQNGAMPKLVEKGEKLEREKSIGKSRIDFVTENSFIEIKTLLITLPTNDIRVTTKSASKFNSFGRLIKHFNVLSDAIKNGRKKRAILLLCYLYDAPAFVPPKTDATNIKIKKVAEMATKAGVEHWQVNLRLNKEGVQLIRYFPLSLFKTNPLNTVKF